MKRKVLVSILAIVVALTLVIIGCVARERVKSEDKKTIAKVEEISGDDSNDIEEVEQENTLEDVDAGEPADESLNEGSEKEEESSTKKETSSTNSTKKESNISKKEETKGEMHTHNWEPVYKEVDNGHYEKVLVKAAWTEEVVKQKKVGAEICKGCGHAMFTMDEVISHSKSASLAGRYECGSWYSGYVIQDYTVTVEHPAEYADQWVPKIEKVVTGYKCSCGATK